MIRVSKEAARSVAADRPPGYLDDLSAASVREDDHSYFLQRDDYARLFEKYRGKPYEPGHELQSRYQSGKLPRLVAWVGRYRKDTDRGLGDTLERLLAAAGGRRFKHLMLLLHLPCGCDDRQRWLNEKYSY